MTVTAYPNDGTPLSEAMLTNALYAMIRDGVLSTPDATFDLNKLVVTFGSGMQVLVASGRALIGGQLFTNDASAGITVANADATNGRIDLIVARNTLTTDTPVLAIKTGTPGVDPTAGKPTPTVSGSLRELALAELLVPAGISNASSGTLTDRRVWARGTNHPGEYVTTVLTTDDSILSTPTTDTLLTSMTKAINTDGGDLIAEFSGSFLASGLTNLTVSIRIDSGSWIARAFVVGISGTEGGHVYFRHRFVAPSAGRHTVDVGVKSSASFNIISYGGRQLNLELL